jgi:hypothetical protein
MRNPSLIDELASCDCDWLLIASSIVSFSFFLLLLKGHFGASVTSPKKGECD